MTTKKGTLGAALTDTTGVSPITPGKLAKDAIADALLALPGALIAANIVNVPTDEKTAMTAAVVIIGVVIKALYRAALRWATT